MIKKLYQEYQGRPGDGYSFLKGVGRSLDEGSILFYVIAIILLVACSAFFSATETAFSCVSRIRLKNYVNMGRKRAKKALKVSENFDTALSAILIGNNIVNIAAASLGTVFFTGLLGDAGVGISTIVMTVFVLIFGEVVPKSLAKQHPESVAMFSAGIMLFLMKLFLPLVWVLQGIVKQFSKKLGGKTQPTVTEEELKYIIEEIEDEGVLNEHESELVQSAIDFDDITVDEILTPRVDVAAVEEHQDAESVKETFFATGFTRLPVYEKNIDNIIGVINEKDFMRAYISNPQVELRSLLQNVTYVPPKKRISILMKELQHNRLHIAVVTDPFGGTIGIITLEDIIEELVGEIWDESDKVTEDLEQLSNDVYRVNGDYNVYDLFETLEIDDSHYEGSSQSVSGWALDVFEHIPEPNETFDFENLHVGVENVQDQRITSFLIRVSPVELAEE